MGDKKYNRTFKVKMVVVYADMKRRVNGNTRAPELYLGLPICTKEEFYEFTENDPIYIKLHEKWKESDYDYFYKPSIDRIIPEKGYVLSNIRWITEQDNKKRHKADLSKYDIAYDDDLPF